MDSSAAADRDRRTDRAVAEALGWVDFWESRDGVWLMGYPPVEQGAGIDAERHPVPHFSTDLAAAWTLIDHVVPQGWDYELSNNGSVITCVLIDEPYRSVTGTGATPEEAICRAFLAAVGEGGEL